MSSNVQINSEAAPVLRGERALAASVGGDRYFADWKKPDHRLRRLLSEFIGMSGLTFVLSGGAAILALHGGGPVRPWEAAFVLSTVSALWLVAAVYFLGDISAHFNPAMTFAFALRGDMGWPMAGVYFVVQLVAAAAGSLLAMANGPKLNGPFVPLAVGAYIMSWGTMGGPFEGASMNPARSFGPDLARGDLTTWWIYVVGPAAGAIIAVIVARILRGPALAQEARAAMGTPLGRG